MTNIQTILLSFLYIGIVMIIATTLGKIFNSKKEFTRKFIHIMVGNWVFLYPFYTKLWALLFVPMVFILINTLSLKYALIEAMERDENDGYGTVYYAISLTIMAYCSFMLNEPIILYVGTLIMTYGDGFAAIIGKKFGKNVPIRSFPNKSWAGSLTVLLISFFVIIGSLLYFQSDLKVIEILIIGIIGSFASCFIELTATKGMDNLTLPLGVGSLVYMLTLSNIYSSLGIMLLMSIILGYAYKKKSINLDGSIMAMLVGLTLFVLGTLEIFCCLIMFFVFGSLISKITNPTKDLAESKQEFTGARTSEQVFANALLPTILVWLNHLSPGNNTHMLVAFALFSTSFADTFASELGMLFNSRVVSILDFKQMPAGVSGGISLPGTVSGLFGAFIGASFAINYGITSVIVVSLLGFFGMILDSYLGAKFQRKFKVDGDILDFSKGKSVLISGYSWISNNTVNVLSQAIILIIAFLIIK